VEDTSLKSSNKKLIAVTSKSAQIQMLAKKGEKKQTQCYTPSHVTSNRDSNERRDITHRKKREGTKKMITLLGY